MSSSSTLPTLQRAARAGCTLNLVTSHNCDRNISGYVGIRGRDVKSTTSLHIIARLERTRKKCVVKDFDASIFQMVDSSRVLLLAFPQRL